MGLAFDDIIKAVTPDQVREVILTILDVDLPTARSWRKGGVYSTLMAAVSAVISQASFIQVEIAKGGFLDKAQGAYLTLLAKAVYNVDRREETQATGKVTFTNAGSNPISRAAGELTLVNPTTGKTYRTTEALTLVGGSSQTIAIESVEFGVANSSPPGTITQLGTPLLDVTVNNAASVLATDEQPDEDLRTDCRNKLASLSIRGPRGAYAFAVSQAKRSDGSQVNLKTPSISPSSSTGEVTVYLAAPTGAPLDEDVTAVVDSIEAIARPDCVIVHVLPITEVSLARPITVWADRTPGVDVDAIRNDVLNDLTIAIQNYPIGGKKKGTTQGYLTADYLDRIIIGANDAIYDCDGTGDDLTLNPGDVVVLNIQPSDITVRFPGT